MAAKTDDRSGHDPISLLLVPNNALFSLRICAKLEHSTINDHWSGKVLCSPKFLSEPWTFEDNCLTTMSSLQFVLCKERRHAKSLEGESPTASVKDCADKQA